MADLIEAMQTALAAFSAGRVIQPVRTVVEFGERRFFGLMPALDPDAPMLGAKLLTFLPDNTALGLASHQASIALFDPTTGVLVAITDGRYITEARTAAVSAVSLRHLARPESRVLAILGSGVQAHSHLEALPLVHRFTEIRVWSPNVERLRHFADEHGITAASSAEVAVRGADVIVLATASTTPVIEDAWVSAGAHIIAVGACRYNHREVAPELMARSLLICDSRAAAMKEAGDVLLAIASGHLSADPIHAELGEVVAGTKSGRTSAGQITLFKSLGLAIEDVVSAGLAYRRARESGRGTEVPN
jgi:alanine dehydrogenase